jgi:NADH:ubiquinone oxidoreductase subunit F (NADH-binding)
MTTPAGPSQLLAGSRLLGGPDLQAGAEPYSEHLRRLGELPPAEDRLDLIAAIEAAGLLGRGGASFPVGRKWRSVAERSAGGGAVVLANGAEGEPLSAKDRTLMALRPHLVLDGAELAADAVGADEIIVYVGRAHVDARRSIDRAVAERSPARSSWRGGGRRAEVRVVAAPDRYVAGEESAAVHFVNAGDARPTTTPPRPFEAGVHGRPTLVQNVESLASAALIGRFGDGWYREVGRGPTRGTGLVTVTGISRPGVREIELGTTVAEVAAGAGAEHADVQAVLLGGYFGGWVGRDEAWNLALDPATVRESGRSFGCGVVSLLSHDVCGVRATARIADYMAGQSAAQCGPCVFGLRAIADATGRIAGGAAGADDLDRIERWAGQLAGRGACRHPDGAVGLLKSALELFGDEFELHQRARRCSRIAHPAVAA